MKFIQKLIVNLKIKIYYQYLLLVAPGSIPGGVTGFFSDAFPSDGTMALGSTQPSENECQE